MCSTKIYQCIHCGTPYGGEGSVDPWEMMTPNPYEDDRYCPDCMRLVVNALKDVPKKYEWRWVESTNYTREQIVANRDATFTSDYASKYPESKRMMTSIVCERMPDYDYYMFTHWNDEHPFESAVVYRESLVEIKTGNPTTHSKLSFGR